MFPALDCGSQVSGRFHLAAGSQNQHLVPLLVVLMLLPPAGTSSVTLPHQNQSGLGTQKIAVKNATSAACMACVNRGAAPRVPPSQDTSASIQHVRNNSVPVTQNYESASASDQAALEIAPLQQPKQIH
jgi:hypothetical protein